MQCNLNVRRRTTRVSTAIVLAIVSSLVTRASAAQALNDNMLARAEPALSRAEMRERLSVLPIALADTSRTISRAPFVIGGALLGAGITGAAIYRSARNCTDCWLTPTIIAIPIIGGAGVGSLAGLVVHTGVRAAVRHDERMKRERNESQRPRD